MNIFLFDPLNLKSQAQAHPDKLVVKMQLEASQLLANAMSSLYNLSLPKKILLRLNLLIQDIPAVSGCVLTK